MYKRVRNIKNEKMFYVFDLIAAAVLIAVIIAVVVTALKPKGSEVQIYVDGQLEYTYELSNNRVVTLEKNGHKNVIEIKDGRVSMIESDCRNQICVNSGAISEVGQQIVCLPNKIIVVITGDGGELDATT